MNAQVYQISDYRRKALVSDLYAAWNAYYWRSMWAWVRFFSGV